MPESEQDSGYLILDTGRLDYIHAKHQGGGGARSCQCLGIWGTRLGHADADAVAYGVWGQVDTSARVSSRERGGWFFTGPGAPGAGGWVRDGSRVKNTFIGVETNL